MAQGGCNFRYTYRATTAITVLLTPVDTEWLQYLVQMILSWGDNETIVSISIQIIFDNLCDNEEKKLFLSNQSTFVLRILCLESKFVDIQLHASRFVHNVVKGDG